MHLMVAQVQLVKLWAILVAPDESAVRIGRTGPIRILEKLRQTVSYFFFNTAQQPQQTCCCHSGYQTFADLTFADQTFGDIWGQTFGALTNGEHKH